MKDHEKHFRRGVFTMPFRDAVGRTIAVAIDRSGRCVDWLAFHPEERVEAYTRLWAMVGQHDEHPASLREREA